MRLFGEQAMQMQRALGTWLLPLVLCTTTVTGSAWASDHADTRQLSDLKRDDAKIADFYSFSRGDRLVLVMMVQVPLPEDLTKFKFPSDVAYRFMIDRDVVVTSGDAEDMRLFGGVISDPAAIKEDVVVARSSRVWISNRLRIAGLTQSSSSARATSWQDAGSSYPEASCLSASPLTKGDRIARRSPFCGAQPASASSPR